MIFGVKSKPVSDVSVICMSGIKCFADVFVWQMELWNRLTVSLAELRLLVAVEVGLEPRPCETCEPCCPQRKLIIL